MRKNHNKVVFLYLLLICSCSSTTERVIDNYPNGNPKIISIYKKSGNEQTKIREVHYYESGQKECEYSFKDGMKNGKYYCWFENGRISMEGSYKDNKFEGEALFYFDTVQSTIRARRFFKNNNLFHEILYYKTGNKLDESFYANGIQRGRWTVWHPNGQKQLETTDCWNGKQTEWYDNGVKKSEGMIEGSKKTGWWMNWDSLGKLMPETFYRNDSIIEKQKP